jgi:hypothetical protein
MNDTNFIILYLLVISHYFNIDIKRGRYLAMHCTKTCHKEYCKEISCRFFDSEGKLVW